MKRVFLNICVILLLACAAAEAEGIRVHVDDVVHGFGDNELRIEVASEGIVTVKITDDAQNLIRTILFPVAEGENRLIWDGLGENEEQIENGSYTLTVGMQTGDGWTEASETIRTQKCNQALLFALPSSETLYLGGGETWFAEVKLIRAGYVCMTVASSETPSEIIRKARWLNGSNGVFRLKWDGGGLAAGDYVLRYWAEDNPAYVCEIALTLAEGACPTLPVEVTGELFPTAMDDATVWAAMMQPSVVVKLSKATDHQTVYEQPSRTSKALGTVHGQTQAVEVLALREDGWAEVAAWNHETGSRMRGYVPQQVLQTVRPNTICGILVDKASQTMSVYVRGEKIGTVPISTGQPTAARMYRETPAGAFLTCDRLMAFSENDYRYYYPIRYDGGNLLHQIGYQEKRGTKSYADQTNKLGSKASHGCIRIPRERGNGGLNAYWLWTHIPYHTRVLILDDPAERISQAEELGVTLPDAELYEQEETDKMQTAAAAYLLQDLDFEDEDAIVFPIKTETITLTLGGDAVLGTREAWWQREDALPAYLEKYGMAYPFSGLSDVFTADDMTFINLECTLKANRQGENTTKLYRFRGLPSYAQILNEGSIEQVNIANNHYVDYDYAGRNETREALEAAEIPYSGYGYTYVWECKGHKIGFAGCRETIYRQNKQVIEDDIRQLREQGCEVVIYSCHWGTEYEPTHNKLQEEMAAVAAAAGADLVVGNHPHVVQGVSEVSGTPVLWSLGNLMFGGTIDMTTFDAVLIRAELLFENDEYRGITLRYLPILTSSVAASGVNDYRPVLAEEEDAERIYDAIQADSTLNVHDPLWFPR